MEKLEDKMSVGELFALADELEADAAPYFDRALRWTELVNEAARLRRLAADHIM